MMNEKRTQRSLNFLKVYTVVLTLAFAVLAFYVINQKSSNSFEEISVERINVVEADGSLKLVISNGERQHSGIINGKPLPERKRQAGMIFFNGIGDECGGLLYDSNDQGAGLILSVDKFREDQVMQLKYEEAIGQHLRIYGMQFWDYPKEDAFDERMEAAAKLQKLETAEERNAFIQQLKKDSLLMNDRMFVGHNLNEEFGLFIKDKNGKARIRIYVDKDNHARIELLDEDGNVIKH